MQSSQDGMWKSWCEWKERQACGGGWGGGGQQQDQVMETERNTVSPGRPEEEPALRKSARGSGK